MPSGLEPEATLHVMLALAGLTPVVALLAWHARRRGARPQSHEPDPSGEPLSVSPASTPASSLESRARRNLLLLGLAGPANLLLWLLLRGPSAREPLGDSAGWLVAALVFVVASFATGLAPRALAPLRGAARRR